MTSGMPAGWAGTGGVASFTDGLTAPRPFARSSLHRRPTAQPSVARPDTGVRAGVICNGKARRNLAEGVRSLKAPVSAMPRSHAELHRVLASFAARDVNLIVIDGGDGTVRDVISAATRHFPGGLPRLAVIPSGKTNALALDLGIQADWSVQASLDAAHVGRIEQRSPIEISRPDGSAADLRGFIFGSGAFVRATALAQRTHRVGAFNGVAVGLSIAGGIVQTLFGGRDNGWRRGDMLRAELPGGDVVERPHYMMFASTLMRLPTGIKPFGRVRAGLKLLCIDAPPKRVLTNLPALLLGSEAASLRRDGYHRIDTDEVRLTLESGFILDGEACPGGEIVVRRGAPIRFVVP